jgi:tetratricopeptide (TPR) repeat protein
MRLNNFLPAATAAVLLFICSAMASAQVAQLRGQVQMKQADGKLVPVAGAQIDVYRTDLPGKYPTTTDKKGNFVYAGLPLTGRYVVAISAPGASPTFQSDVKPGGEKDLSFILDPGDGRRLTEEEAKRGGASTPAANASGKESAEDKAKREELIRKNKEIMAQNEKNKNINEVVGRTFKAGNEALLAKRYDEAVTAYDEGLASDPEQQALWTNKGRALIARGVDRYNKGEKDPGKADIQAGAEAAGKGVQIIKSGTPPSDPADLARYNSNKVAAYTVYTDAMRLYVSIVDHSKANEGIKAFDEYIAVETDQKKKDTAELQSAKLLFDANEFDKALEAYKKILARKPDDPDALVYCGLSLFNMGAMKDDKAQYQEAANYLQQFYDHAPDAHPLKADAKAVLDNIKENQKIKAEKPTNTRRRG